MTALAAPPAPTAPAGRFGGLLRAELHRFTARRFIRVLLLLAVAGWALGVVLSLVNFASPSPERVAAAQAEIAQSVAADQQYREECGVQAEQQGMSVDDYCGPALTTDDYSVADFLSPQPFSTKDLGVAGAVGVGAAAAVLAFLVGGTFVGAEWSSRSIVALLFWETRRARVLGAKALVVTGAGLLLGVLAQAVWIGTAFALRAMVGDGQPLPTHFWPDLLGTSGRAVLLTVLAGLLGFGLTNLVRNTGAALGIGFVYFAVVETAVRALWPTWQPWLITNDAVGLLLKGGFTWYEYPDEPTTVDGYIEPIEHVVGNLQSGVFLTAVVLAIVALGSVLFVRRDLQ